MKLLDFQKLGTMHTHTVDSGLGLSNISWTINLRILDFDIWILNCHLQMHLHLSGSHDFGNVLNSRLTSNYGKTWFMFEQFQLSISLKNAILIIMLIYCRFWMGVWGISPVNQANDIDNPFSIRSKRGNSIHSPFPLSLDVSNS